MTPIETPIDRRSFFTANATTQLQGVAFANRSCHLRDRRFNFQLRGLAAGARRLIDTIRRAVTFFVAFVGSREAFTIAAARLITTATATILDRQWMLAAIAVAHELIPTVAAIVLTVTDPMLEHALDVGVASIEALTFH